MANNIIQFPGNATQASALAAPGAPVSATPSPGSDQSDPFWVGRRVWNILYAKNFSAAQKQRIIYNFIWTHENSKTDTKSAWLRTRDGSKAYLYEGRRNRLYTIDHKDKQFCGYLWQMYGLNSTETIGRYIITALQHGTIAMGLVRDVRRFTYWDRRARALYISGYDGTCYQITGNVTQIFEGVKVVANGAGPSLFLDDDKGSGPDDPLLNNHGVLFPSLIDDLQYAPTTVGGMSPAIQRTCLGIWMFTIAFPDLMPTKPLLLVEGAPGSGKTTALKRLALALHGKYMPLQVPKQEDKDFGVKILRSPIAILDDVNELVEWFRDTVSSYATGAGWSKRALFTNDDEHIIKPESFLTVTTNNPATFRQSQVADRCLIMRLGRRQDKDGFLAEDQLFQRTHEDRNEIFGEWLWWLNEIVAELRKAPVAISSKTRMADFAHLAHVIARVLARPRPAGQRPGPSGDWSPAAVDEMLECMQSERDALVIEGDPLIDLIDRWLDTASNQGKEIRAADLHRDLSNIAKQSGQTTFFRSPKALMHRLSQTADALAHHFTIEKLAGPNNAVHYVFRRA